ncbi:manganese/zinc/iron transport system ATP-binding protein [Spirochaetota bacterium]|nr:manganese/zinc/iron transport system ATP-binding protein [Spirochaetota bacterium]
MEAVHLEKFEIRYGTHIAACGDNLSIPLGVMGAIVGPNGAGKSSLIKVLSSLKSLTSGTGTVLGMPLPLTKRQPKLKIAYLPQHHHFDQTFPISALEVVLMGAYGRLGWIKRPQKADHNAALAALEQVNLLHLKNKTLGTLSGGEQQRVFLARALLQQSDLYLMDEPLNGIDIESTKLIVAAWRHLNRAGKTILAIHHDLSTLQAYFNHITIIKKHVLASGTLTRPFSKNIQTALKKAYQTYSFISY